MRLNELGKQQLNRSFEKQDNIFFFNKNEIMQIYDDRMVNQQTAREKPLSQLFIHVAICS